MKYVGEGAQVETVSSFIFHTFLMLALHILSVPVFGLQPLIGGQVWILSLVGFYGCSESMLLTCGAFWISEYQMRGCSSVYVSVSQ